jgi:hypothetical protein
MIDDRLQEGNALLLYSRWQSGMRDAILDQAGSQCVEHGRNMRIMQWCHGAFGIRVGVDIRVHVNDDEPNKQESKLSSGARAPKWFFSVARTIAS